MTNDGRRTSEPDHIPSEADSAEPDSEGSDPQQELADELRGQAAAWARPEEVDRLAGEMAEALGKLPQRQQLEDDESEPSEEPDSEETTPETWLTTAW